VPNEIERRVMKTQNGGKTGGKKPGWVKEVGRVKPVHVCSVSTLRQQHDVLGQDAEQEFVSATDCRAGAHRHP
jgi:hypothetical protein